jgi:RNA polymerase sigma-70 factor (ECF subfamily)
METSDLERVVGEFYPSLYRFGLALSRSEADATELTQQVFYLWSTEGHHRDGKVKSWLFTSLYREFLDKKRRDQRLGDAEQVPESSIAETETATCVIDKLDGQIAQKALLDLEENYRAPLALFYLQEHSCPEIAEILDIPIETVRSRIWRGKLKLRKLLADAAGEAKAMQ